MTTLKYVVKLTLVLWLVACGGGSDEVSVTDPKDRQSPTFKVLSATSSSTAMLDQTPTGFFYPTGQAQFSTGSGWWLSKAPDYFAEMYHIGTDMMLAEDKNVYAIADGKIYRRHCDDDSWGSGNCALFVEHKTSDGTRFTALYGHLTRGSTAGSGDVYAGKPVGKIGHWNWGDHLHFGIFQGTNVPATQSGVRGWGMMNLSQWPDTNSFIDPVSFIQNNYAYNPSTEVQVRCIGPVCWSPVQNSCENATNRYRLGNNMVAQPAGASVCVEAQDKLFSIADGPNPQSRVPEDPPWQRAWRHIRNLFGKNVSAADIQAFPGTVNTVQVLTGHVVSGSASRAIYGTGEGYPTQVTDPPTSGLPDFATDSMKAYDLAGNERYSFSQGETMRVHHVTCNVGDANWAGERDDMYVMLLLSRGYKEDSHSEWREAGREQIQRGNIDAGTCKSEYFTVNLATINNGSPIAPGIYNYVGWPDRKYLEDNGDGEVPEKHKSNNRSTELVFEVTLDPSVPRPDFTVHGLVFLQTPIYAADPARLGGYIRNAGSARPWSGIRSQYSVECPGTGRIPLTDDGTDADQLDPGESAYESNQSLVYMPNVAGQCTVRLCADHADEVLESDETNNCQAIPITLQPRPAAKLVIASFADVNNCCTTNTGSRLYPRVFVRNDGNAAPASPYPPVIYHIASPVATGGRYIHMGNGSLRQTSLGPGQTHDDTMDGNGWIIPTSGGWKLQWHTIRACIRADGGQPIGDEATEVCRVYQHYSRK